MNRYDIEDVQNVLNMSTKDLLGFLSCVNPDEDYEWANITAIFAHPLNDIVMVEIVYGVSDSTSEFTERVTLASMIEFLEN